MSARSSFPAVAEQIITYNKNLTEILSKINALQTTTEPVINVQIVDASGVITQYSLPSFSYLKGEIDRLSNNINSLYNLNTSGALVSESSGNKFKKVITIDLNK